MEFRKLVLAAVMLGSVFARVAAYTEATDSVPAGQWYDLKSGTVCDSGCGHFIFYVDVTASPGGVTYGHLSFDEEGLWLKNVLFDTLAMVPSNVSQSGWNDYLLFLPDFPGTVYIAPNVVKMAQDHGADSINYLPSGTMLIRQNGYMAKVRLNFYDLATGYLHFTYGYQENGTEVFDDNMIFVDSSAVSGARTGKDWANAYTDLQNALQTAQAGDEIWVAKGTYYPSDTLRSVSFTLKNYVDVNGGFTGTEKRRDQRTHDPGLCILSGDIGNKGDSSDNSQRVVSGGSMQYGVLDGFTICDGNGAEASAIRIGGRGDVLVKNCVIKNNISGDQGGAIILTSYAYLATTIRFVSCRFTGNRGNGAGVVFSESGQSVFERCIFKKNESTGTRPGGVFVSITNDTTTFINCIFEENRAEHGGVAAVNMESEVRFINCVMAKNNGETGSVVETATQSSAEIINCIMWGNERDQFFNSCVMDFDGSKTTLYYCCLDFTKYGVGCIDDDPMFINYDEGDYRLQALSPCKDAANGDQAPEYDLEGMPRYDDTGIINSGSGLVPYMDIGAYENQENTGVVDDTVKPYVVHVLSRGLKVVDIRFNEMMSRETCEEVLNYTISDQIDIQRAYLKPDNKSVFLITDNQEEGNEYTVTISGVADAALSPNAVYDTTVSYIATKAIFDDFENGPGGSWDSLLSTGYETREYNHDNAVFIDDGHIELASAEDYGTFTVTFEVAHPFSGDDRFIFCITDADNYFSIQFNPDHGPDRAGIYRTIDGVEHQVVVYSDYFFAEAMTFYQMAVQCDTANNRITMYHELVSDALFDTTISGLVPGKIGFGSGEFAEMYIDNVKIEKVILPNPLYEEEYILFSAQQKGADGWIRWVPEYELDVAGWNILKSDAAYGIYNVINDTMISGTKQDGFLPVEYSFIDTAVTPGSYYYKLQKICLDGKVELAPPVKLEVISSSISYPGKKTLTDAGIYVNTLVTNNNLIMSVPREQQVSYELYMHDGRRVLSQKPIILMGKHSIAMGQFKPGVYLFKINVDGNAFLLKIHKT